MALLLYLDQNYLSGIVKGEGRVPESEAHRLESGARPDLPLLELLRELSAGLRLPNGRGTIVSHCERRLEAILEREFPERRRRASDRLDIRALAAARPHCRLVTCDAFMADVVHRTVWAAKTLITQTELADLQEKRNFRHPPAASRGRSSSP
jgi:hypothetical protein